MKDKTDKIIVNDQWAEKFLRESVWMPFGSMCNLVGQAYQGQSMTETVLQNLAETIFTLSMDFTKRAYERVEKAGDNSGEVDIPVK